MNAPDERTALSVIEVVLVEPQDSRNVGMVARAMSNLGVQRLHLVTPRNFDVREAAITACWGMPVLEGAQQWGSLEEAVAPFDDVIGFTAKRETSVTRHCWLPEWVDELQDTPLPQRCALLFGPEDTGLRVEHMPYCRTLVSIAAAAQNPVFNLAQAVLLVCYELWRRSEGVPQPLQPKGRWGEFEQLDKMITKVAEQVGFYHEHTPEVVPRLVQNLLRRTTPTEREMQILLGLFGGITRALEGQRNRR